jgi:hypothetical protein
MKKIELADIKNLYEYEKIRQDYRKKIIEIKKHRRISLGNRLTFVFENRETVLFQIQEMLRTERIVDEAKIQNELDIFNQLIPEESELSVTMFIEMTEQWKFKKTLESFADIEDDHLYIKINRDFLYAQFDRNQIRKNGLSSIQYIKFKFNKEQKETFLYKNDVIFLCIKHPEYSFYTAISDDMKSSLRVDFLN